MQPQATLPIPDTDSLRHSERVTASLKSLIADAGGSISFGEFMQHALYAPGLGYYAAGTQKFGAAGDFVTAPEVSPLFGRVLARQSAGVLAQLGNADVLEFGAGSGALAEHVLAKLAALEQLPRHYLILDVSADLRERQRERLTATLPALVDRVRWLDALPKDFRGVVIANEVADALPVERFVVGSDGLQQMRVAVDDDRFAWRRASAPGWMKDAVATIERDLGRALPPGFVSELSPGLHGWLADIGASLGEAVVFLFDYGVARHEYYAPDRDGGWLRCHFRHRVHGDPLVYPGIQDLTAWVDFTAAAEAAVAAGLSVAGFVTQAGFPLNGGLAEELAELRRRRVGGTARVVPAGEIAYAPRRNG
ncbi:MAG: SAM-dependent methyltransferase [Woeseiaceae bacterium]|nr:SAM-dependent methyltransferase [Woeseiaceae bacterium]